MRRRLLIRTVASLGMLVLVGLTSGYLYLRGNAFEHHLERTLTALTGSTVELGEGASIQSLLPTLRLTVPAARLRSIADDSIVQRVRVRGLELETSLRALISGGRSGTASIAIATVTAIVSTRSADHGGNRSVHQESLVSLAGRVIERLVGLRAAVSIDKVDLIVRDARSRSSHWRATGVRLESAASSVEMDADISFEDGRSRAVIVHATELKRDPSRVSGSVRVEVQDANDADSQVNVLSGVLAIVGERIALSPVEYRDGTGWLRGELQFERRARRLSLTGNIDVRRLRLAALARRLQQSVRSDDENGARLFEYRPFDWRLPQTLAVDIALHFGAVRLGDLPVMNGNARLWAERGLVTLTGRGISLFGGQADLEFGLDTRTAHQTVIDMRIRADDIELARLRHPESDAAIVDQGRADLIVALKGSGPSPGHIAASLDGYLIGAVDNAVFNQRYSTAMDRGILSWALERLAVISSRVTDGDTGARLSDPLAIDCASVRIHLNDGRAEVSNGVIIELPDNTLYSSGFIDFRSEELGFAFRTRRKSLFDWSAIAIARFVELGGSLGEPTLELNRNELLKQGVMSASSVAWGPLPGLVYSLGEAGLRNRQSMTCTRSID